MILTIRRTGVLMIRPMWLRALLLAVFAAPAFSDGLLRAIPSFSTGLDFPTSIDQPLAALPYAAAVYLVIAWTFGTRGLTKILAIAVPLALAVAFAMTALPKLPVVGEFLLGSKNPAEIDALAVHQFLTMIAVIPLGFFIVQSFPPIELISAARSGRSVSPLIIKLAILLRMYSIVLDGVSSFFAAWTEENPSQLLPRHRKDIGSVEKLWKLPMWAIGAAKTWGIALITHAIEQIPQLIEQLEMSAKEDGHAKQ